MPPRKTTVARSQQAARSLPADSWTPDLIRQAELAADAGQLRWAAELCDALLGDDRVGACRDQLVAILGLPLEFEDGVGKARRKARRALEAEEDWWDAFSDESLGELLWWGVHLGVGIGELLWEDKGDRVVPRLKVWHPRALRFDALTSTWFVRLGDGSEEAVVIGDGRWVVFTPKSESSPWQHGGYRAASRWWRLKRYAMFDWGEACEQAKGLKVASTTDGTNPDRDKLVEDLVSAGGDVAVALPPGWTMSQLAMSASTKDMFDGLCTTANTATAVRYLGQNLTTEVTGGSFAAAGVHASIASSILRALASALAACLRVQVLVPWALFNFGASEAAPWPVWPVDPPADAAKDATTAQARVSTAGALAAQGVLIDWGALAEELKFAQLPAPTLTDGDASAPKDPAAALNGAQVSSLLEIVSQAAAGAIPRETALQLLTAAFPLDAAKANAILGTVGQGFVPKVPPDGKPTAPPELPGAGGAPPPPFTRAGRPAVERRFGTRRAVPRFDPAHPFWVYRMVRHKNPAVCHNVCDDHDGAVVRGDDDWWTGHTPPLHYGCNCYVEQLDGKGHRELPPDERPDPEHIGTGFGRGQIPLADQDAELNERMEDIAKKRLRLPVDALGRPPLEGGTGEVYNPRLDAPGRVTPRRSLEVGGWVDRLWFIRWPQWDQATVVDRSLAVLILLWVIFEVGRTLEDLLAEHNVEITEGAQKILDTEDGRLREAIVTERAIDEGPLLRAAPRVVRYDPNQPRDEGRFASAPGRGGQRPMNHRPKTPRGGASSAEGNGSGGGGGAPQTKAPATSVAAPAPKAPHVLKAEADATAHAQTLKGAQRKAFEGAVTDLYEKSGHSREDVAHLVSASLKTENPTESLKDAHAIVSRPGISSETVRCLGANAVGRRPWDLGFISRTKLSDPELNFLAGDRSTSWTKWQRAAELKANPKTPRTPKEKEAQAKIAMQANLSLRGAAAEYVAEQQLSTLLPGHTVTGRQIETGGKVIDFKVTTPPPPRDRIVEVKATKPGTWREWLDCDQRKGKGEKLSGKKAEFAKKIDGFCDQMEAAANASHKKRPVLAVTSEMKGTKELKALTLRLRARGVRPDVVFVTENDIVGARNSFRAGLGMSS